MNALQKAIYLAARMYWAIARPLTLGVRVIMRRGDEVLLVKHTYQDRWFFPGGLVERGETLDEAARREAREEVGAELGPLTLLGIFSNFDEGKADHITVFYCSEFSLQPAPNAEIERFAFFRLDALPPDISAGTRRRIESVLSGATGPTFGPW
ncbi:MAG: NUDIX domain-containing protein [Anaerolineae bacterium]|nr:NUDIX domain-containing protein [Anaerolineae bacterium]